MRSAAQPPTDTGTPAIQRGLTLREFARLFRMGKDRARGLIVRGELGAVNTAPSRCGRPRYVILPQHVSAFVESRRATTPPKPAPRRRRTTTMTDFYPD